MVGKEKINQVDQNLFWKKVEVSGKRTNLLIFYHNLKQFDKFNTCDFISYPLGAYTNKPGRIPCNWIFYKELR